MDYCLLANLLTRWYGDRMGVQDRIKVYGNCKKVYKIV